MMTVHVEYEFSNQENTIRYQKYINKAFFKSHIFVTKNVESSNKIFFISLSERR